jgi:alkylation response protein AidB-like acyl-CoA dehydrogenase
MPAYKAPTDDMLFLLRDVFDAPAIFAAMPAYSEVDDGLIEAILGEAAKFCENELAPINRGADEAGCRLEGGAVRTAPGFREAYGSYVEGGWPGLSLPAEYGGQGLPKTLQFLVDEMISGANMAFGLFPGLTRGAVEAIEAHGSEELKARWLPAMVSGRWTGAMCLTEPQAGTDLGALRTRAQPAADGSWRITGTKIFITNGDHDLADNIVHLVLARLPDAPEGTRGISLFLVPKMLVGDDGGLRGANGVSCGSLEHKMGIKASPTCVMNFDEATGWLVGEPNKGLAAMFTMMNSERLFVGVQGIGIAGAAYQAAAAYAKERIQGRDPATGRPVPIIAHADVRRNLLTARAWAEGMRALAVWTSLQLDRAAHHPDSGARAEAEGLVALITPVIKAAGSDFGLEAAIAAQQVFGGHGYVREWGMEQFVRDVRIAQIYEGTNGVQALDLVARKLFADGGALPRRFFALVERLLSQTAGETRLDAYREDAARALALLRRVTTSLGGLAKNPVALSAAATDYLRLFALIAQAWMWLWMARSALIRPEDDVLREGKLALATFFFHRLLPQTESLAAAVQSGGEAVMSLTEEAF